MWHFASYSLCLCPIERSVKYIHSLKLYRSKVIQVFFFIQAISSSDIRRFDRLDSPATTKHSPNEWALLLFICSFGVYCDLLACSPTFAHEILHLTFSRVSLARQELIVPRHSIKQHTHPHSHPCRHLESLLCLW